MKTTRIAVTRIDDIDAFFSAVDKCKNPVVMHNINNEFRLDLKSNISKIVCLTTLSESELMFIEALGEEDTALIEEVV